MDLDSVFEARGLEEDVPPYRYELERRVVGTLRVPSGTIVAADPFAARAPFTRGVPPGAYPVEIVVASTRTRLPGGDERRCAFARVRFGEGAVARWELALVPGQDPTTLGPLDTFGY